MAQRALRLPENVPGDFYVDSTCIDCDTCRQIAPTVFRDHGDASSVYHQPDKADETQRALMALVACPTGSIGTEQKHELQPAIAGFPERVAENVFFCGFTAESSFGAWSYLIVRPPEQGGNVLVDSPRFASHLVRRIEELGGVRTMFLSHQDDIADHEKWASHFSCRRVMHVDEGAARLGIEHVLAGEAPVQIEPELLAIATRGHTRGHVCLLYRDKFLFTGDHLAWSPERQTLIAFHDACWYSWAEQTRSMARLLDYRFEWVLPGHGRIGHGDAATMHEHLRRCVEWMKRAA
ncbi:MAG: MBL fold metallo-hydrolase [Acidobacteria bacterium]|nr:MBL fold metallo-hydrolase [Acidobacteriota bacterium]